MVSLGGVVENDVEDDLDARAMQRFHHVPKFMDRPSRILARAVSPVGGEERNRRVAPIVLEPGRSVVRIELEHGQQLDRRDAELLKVRNFFDHARDRCRAGSPRRRSSDAA